MIRNAAGRQVISPIVSEKREREREEKKKLKKPPLAKCHSTTDD